MSETTPNDRTDDVSDELRDTGDDVSRGADRAKDEVAEGADRVKDGVRDAADKVSDTVEDMIPGRQRSRRPLGRAACSRLDERPVHLPWRRATGRRHGIGAFGIPLSNAL
jgi:hypothetical protein